MLPQEEHPLQVVRREEAGNQTRIRQTHFPEMGGMTVGHEAKRSERLALGDLGDVMTELLIGFTRMPGTAFGFHHREHLTARLV